MLDRILIELLGGTMSFCQKFRAFILKDEVYPKNVDCTEEMRLNIMDEVIVQLKGNNRDGPMVRGFDLGEAYLPNIFKRKLICLAETCSNVGQIRNK